MESDPLPDGIRVGRSSRVLDLIGLGVVLLALGAGFLILFGPGLLASPAPAARQAATSAALGTERVAATEPPARRDVTPRRRSSDRAAVEATVAAWKDRVVEGEQAEPYPGTAKGVRIPGVAGPVSERRMRAAVERAIARGWLTLDPPGSPPSGMALFPPMGTQPLQSGIVVPEGFELPPGYVRHYQVSDGGERLPAILMFSPDYEWLDADGRPVAIPENGIVPPEMAPPGLPIVLLEVPEQGSPPASP